MNLAIKTAALFIFALTLAFPSHGQHPGGPPIDGSGVWILDPSDPTVGTSACPFPVEVDFAGKIKNFDLPGNRTILSSPGLNATIINLSDQAKQVTVNITGHINLFNQPDGGFIAIGTGRNLLTDPNYGLTLVIGLVRYAFDGTGNLVEGLNPLAGQTVSLCSLVD